MMKRKLALLLAAVMTVAAVPSTLFAATSENHLTKSGMNVPDYTLFFEQSYVPGGGPVENNSEKIEYWVDGSNLVIELKDAIDEGVNGGVFKITLDNAKWFFRTSVVTPITVASGGADQIATTVMDDLVARYGTTIFADATTAVSLADTKDFTGDGLPAGVTSTFNPGGAVYNDYKYFRLNTPANEAQYMMEISRADETSATVTVLGNASTGNRIVIPLVVRTTGEGVDTRVNITESNTFISRNNYLLASGRSGRTVTTATGTVTSRTDFLLDDIIVREQRFGSIKKDSSFELSAPSGYYFDITKVAVYTELGLSWGVPGDSKAGLGTPSTVTTSPYDNDYYLRYRERNNRIDRSTLEFTFQNINPSTNIGGSIFIRDLLLVADDPDQNLVTGKELSLSIRDTSATTSNKSFTDESFRVGTVSDYIVKLTRVEDKIPELVSGRLDSYTVVNAGLYSSPLNITDENHKAAVVKVEEAIPNAWWAERTTEFTLPEGVRILKAQFTNLTNIEADSAAAIAPTGANVNSEFYNTGTRANGVVTVKDNELFISRLRVTDTAKKANFRLALWLNIDVAFEGDIDLSLSGSAITNEQDQSAVTIAKAIRPVEVLTKVSDIKVGYQYITVADFEIIETKAGNLQQGEIVYISVTDEISVDMNIANGFNASVTDGDLKISNIATRSALGTTGEKIDGQVRFEIDRSSSQASTVKFSNVQVKVDNTVPQSNLSNNNERGINLVVWGSAIAQNYEGLIGAAREDVATINDASRLVTRDFFTTPGIRAKYINIGTPASGGNSSLINVVSVSIGNPVISVGEEQYTMPVAAYVSTASNSTMVPVRFVAYALGLPEGNVIWDPANGTVTVNTASRIVQFQIGNTNYLANGVSVPMISPDGLPVAAEIRDERAFIPFRALGESLGIPITWDEATSTAIYNAPTAQ